MWSGAGRCLAGWRIKWTRCRPFHWQIFLMVIVPWAGPMVGVFRSIKNSSVLHAVPSVFIPVYGLIYFFMGKRQN